MLRRFVPFVVAIMIAAVAWLFFGNFRVAGLGSLRLVPRAASAPSDSETSPVRRMGNSLKGIVRAPAIHATKQPDVTAMKIGSDPAPRIRIGTFNLHALNAAKARKRRVADILARIGREFDVLAVQEIQSDADDVLPRLVQLMNATGQEYDYAIGERVGPAHEQRQYGFIFNRRTVVIDRSELYTVDDRDNLLTYEPFVGWFRAKGTKPEHAFTFSLVNIQIDPATAEQERQVLDELLFAVRDDGRDEDDVILLGDLQAAPGQLGDIDELSDLGFAVFNVPTNVEATAQIDNLLFQKAATSEFTGQSGVFDFLRQYNLDLEDALEVSDHLPVWAEFTVFEGGELGRVARAETEPATAKKF